MTLATGNTTLHEAVRQFVLEGFDPSAVPAEDRFPSIPHWQRLRELGTELWLDTGSIEDASPHWTREFSALTTNNTLLNREVQKGTYDGLIPRAAELLSPFDLTDRQRLLEIAFILNARHGLRLVTQFGAKVSVEEHTDLANDIEGAIEYARRFHAICPEQFIVKIPLTPAGLLATRVVAGEGIEVNHTLGFSARQNYTIARIGRPAYVNVFLGRLNSFVAANDLGDGELVGEKATLASQAAVAGVAAHSGTRSRQIGASFRAGEQVRDLAGLDVMTMPPKVAGEFLDLGLAVEHVTDRTGEVYQPQWADGADTDSAGLASLWDIGDELVACLDAVAGEDLAGWTPDRLVAFFGAHGCGDLLVDWTDAQIALARQDGKIPVRAHWQDELASGRIGLDALLNLSGLESFIGDQTAMDDRITGLLA